MEKLNQLIAKINQETVMTKEWQDPNFLATLLLRLASYYASLGVHIADAERDENLAKTHYEVVRAQTQVDLINAGEPVKKSESAAAVEIVDDVHTYIELRHKARLLFLTRQNLDKTMDAVRSSLAQQGREKEGSRHAT